MDHGIDLSRICPQVVKGGHVLNLAGKTDPWLPS